LKGIKEDLEDAIEYALEQMVEESDTLQSDEELQVHVRKYLTDLGYPLELVSRINLKYGSAESMGEEQCECGCCHLVNSIGSEANN
jgi:hypothetical protein